MKLHFLKAPFIAAALFVSVGMNNIANAGLVTEMWNFEVTETSGSYLQVSTNDIFSIEVTYDDTGTWYFNGNKTLCLSSHTPVAGVNCDDTYRTYSMFSNATFNIANIFDEVTALNENFATYNRGDIEEYSYTFTSRTDTTYLANNTHSSYFKVNTLAGDVLLEFYLQGENGDTITSQVSANLLSIDTVDVPEPSTLAIFALGMIGLASRRLKKNL